MPDKTIYIVTSGEYSDYRIDAVFDTKDLAESFLASRAGEYVETRIEEHPINRHVNLDYYYMVDYNPWAGDWRKWTIRRENESLVPPNQRFNHVVTSKTYFHSPEERAEHYGAKTYTIWVKAKTRDAALKIANEKIMMFIAKEK